MTTLETNCSQNSIDMSYRESMMCMWNLGYRDSKVGCSKSMLIEPMSSKVNHLRGTRFEEKRKQRF